MIHVTLKKYHGEDITMIDIYIYENEELIFSRKQIEKIELPQLLQQILNREQEIVKIFTAEHYPPGCKDKYYYELFIFEKGTLIPLTLSKDIKIEIPVKLPEEIELSVWNADYTDWCKGSKQTDVYFKRKTLKDVFGIEIEFYKKIGENQYEYWLSPSQGFHLGKLYTTEVLQDILKALGVKKLIIEEHNRKSYHPTSSRLFGLKDWSYTTSYEIDLDKWNIKNKYFIISDGDILKIYVELETLKKKDINLKLKKPSLNVN